MSKSGASVLNFISAVQGVSSAGVAGFVDTANNSWVAYTDGSGHVAVIELGTPTTMAGVSTPILGIESAGNTSGYLHIA